VTGSPHRGQGRNAARGTVDAAPQRIPVAFARKIGQSSATATTSRREGRGFLHVAFSDGKPDSTPASAGAGIFLKML
jgi:hypothetical protein